VTSGLKGDEQLVTNPASGSPRAWSKGRPSKGQKQASSDQKGQKTHEGK